MLYKTLKREPKLVQHLVNLGIFRDEPICLVDVGAAGGIDPVWSIFKDQLCVYGFEPKEEECQRLNQNLPSPKSQFFPYLVGANSEVDEIPASHFGYPGSVYWRSSAKRYDDESKQKLGISPTPANQRELPRVQKISLDEFFDARGVQSIDFMKVDTDGSDLQVLKGAHASLSQLGILGLLVECNFNADFHPNIGLYCNLDLYLRKEGFSLYDLEAMRYSRGVLPALFDSARGTATIGGQLHFGDFLFFRDAAYQHLNNQEQIAIQPIKLLKLAALFDLFALPDCAAEVLLTFDVHLRELIDVTQCLNLLVPSVGGKQLTFEQYNQLFSTNIEAFWSS